MERNYAAAIAALNTLQSNSSIVEAVRKSGGKMNEQSIPEMIEWCKKIGYEPSDLARFKPLHIAGTKGKGSTSAFISSILKQYHDGSSGSKDAPPLRKVGLYTSPHLRFVRERIQINNEMLSEADFAKYFFEVWDRLEAAAAPDDSTGKPMYFRYLTLMAFHVFLKEGVDAAVIECGMGGEYDATNVIAHPSVTAITSLGLDHVELLGSTLPQIAWHKAGVFKPGAKAFTVPQAEAAMDVLRQRADERQAELVVVKNHPEMDKMSLGLAAEFQKSNASLAVAVAAELLHTSGYTDVPDGRSIAQAPLPQAFKQGLQKVRWPGRCEIRREVDPAIAWHLDGAHTLESIDVAAQWFGEQVAGTASQSGSRILLFNQQKRESGALAKALHKALAMALGSRSPCSHVVFCTNVTFKSTGYRPDLVSINSDSAQVEKLVVQKQLADTWREIDPSSEVVIKGTIEEAVDVCRSIAKANGESQEVAVMVTGSLHLVGGVIEVLESS